MRRTFEAEGPERLGSLRRPAARECERRAGHPFLAGIDQDQDRGKVRVTGDLAARGDGH